MAPQATSVACVHPSSAPQDEKTDTEKDKKNDNENLQGRLLRQNPFQGYDTAGHVGCVC